MEFNGTQVLITILASIVGGLALRQVMKSRRRRDSESTSRTDNASLQRGSKSTSRTDDASGEHYDVFLSFKGSDTYLNFTSILHRDMVRAGIRVFLADRELKDGGKIDALLNAVKNSRIYVPIFSQHFADSIWCLREVECMVECHSKSNGNKEIIPIFYDVKPDDVKLKTNRYKKALREHKQNFFLSLSGLKRRGKYDSSRVQQWETALQTVGSIRGRELQGKGQGEEIDSIVEVISRKLNTGHVKEPEILVQDIAQVQAIMKLLDVGSDGVRYVGIHGLGGIGKTTLAKNVYNRLRFHFDGFSFLHDIRVQWQHLGGPLNLQKRLLSDYVSSGITDQIKDGGGIEMIKKVLSKKNVLIVLDDLDQKEQLEKLAGKYDWFGSRSRIIFTTRNKEVLTTQVELSNEEPKIIFDYEVQRMEFHLALELFCKHAFGRVSPREHAFSAEKIVRRVGMLPLSVQVIGSHISGLDFALEAPDIQEKLLGDTLQMLDQGGFDDVRKVLMISYNGLKRKEDKEVFLDIACFFTNEEQTYPVIMWDGCVCCPHTAIRVLQQRSLIKIMGKKIWMHDQVRDLGRHIVLEEYTPKFSRVWKHDDVVELLKRKQINEDVEAISLTSSGNGHNLVDEELAALPKLRFLQAKGLDFSGDFKNHLSMLRWLSWQTRGTTFKAQNFHFSRLLVLDLSNSNIEDGWNGWTQMKMNMLKVLDLTGCVWLNTTPDFSNFMSLEKLILARCVKLTTIHSSIGKLIHLKTLNIKGCSSLGELPGEIGSLQSLTEIVMPQNIRPFKLPETFGSLHSLSRLILDEHPGISQLPNSIGGLVKVKHLSLRRCVGITKLPSSIGKMKCLEELDLSKSGIVELPDSIGCLKKLKVIRVSYTVIRKFPCTIGHVEMLEELHAKKCLDLTDENLEEIRKLSHLRILDLSYTEVSEFPTVRGCLSSLQTLEMSSIHLPEVPDLPPSLTRLHLQACHFPSTLHFASLVSLDYLELSRLSASTEEPGPTWTSDSPEERLIHPLPSGLSTLKFKGISLLPPLSNLERLSVLCVIECPMSGFSVSKDLIHLKELTLSKCKSLEKILGLRLLKKLERLDLNRLESLVEIEGLSELESLVYFRICHCDQIARLPGLSKLDKLEHIEVEACPEIRAIEGIESRDLDKWGCTVLKRLIDVSSSTWLSHTVPKNQVFLSFTGADACYSMVDCLRKNLVLNQISVFRDNEEPSSSDGVGEEFPLDDFAIYIPFLSKNYASSRWRLRELAHMVESTSKSNGTKKILPIFYDVEVDDVKLESDLYKSALANHRGKFGNEVEEWEKALREVAGMKWFDLKTKSDGELMDLIVEEVLCKLNAKRVDEPECVVGILPDVDALIESLDVNSGGVRFVAIWGVGGIGKTTHAKVVFNRLLSHFDGACFLGDIGESSPFGLRNLQKKLITGFVGSAIAGQIEDIEAGMNKIKRVCESRKVLIVLDELYGREELKNLAGKSDWFGSGSRIIITTRNRDILETQVESSSQENRNQTEGILTYELRARDDSQALELFRRHAFKGDPPTEEYDHLAKDIVVTWPGHPLFCEVIGSYLYCHCSQLESRGDKRELWIDTLDQLRKLPIGDAYGALMIGYAGLDDNQKEIFLDIACFFSNEDKKYPFIMWEDHSYNPQSEIPILSQRSLIQIRDNKLWMHAMLRYLGRIITWKEYRHSRVWAHDDAIRLLRRRERNEHVKALSLTSDIWSNIIASEELAALPNLKFLRVKGLDFSGNFKNLLFKLIWLSWQPWQVTFHAYNFHFNKLLVLDLSHSNIEDDWGGWSQMKMDRLKVLDLTGCRQLRRTPNFSNFSTLETLILAQCVKLTAIDSSIRELTGLRTLNLDGCISLDELPEEVRSLQTDIIMPPHLTEN
ncbi:disease resistance protein RUN1-like isoform X2 [Rhodamnia argentea]|uniref:Disease resistance protein RUN1-like isoform X2 n=1 Tax=Rhodamnia argentea TaxID=178133 RepID=A0ABM3HAE2_9MYRT|nr:disease resistance protein RUN1-like isoform X2 [Rhodamnia argentea]